MATDNKLTRHQKNFLDKLIADSGITATQAYLDTYPTDNRDTARANASRLLAKANSLQYLNKHIDNAQQRIVQLTSSDNEQIALKASQDILNRTTGLPVARHENTHNHLHISLDLTGADND